MKSINTTTHDFPTLIQEGFVYVDKTAQIHELARRGKNHIYFLPRPRRFGKSLLLSTLKALFTGRRDLFRGLAIEKTGWDWEHEVYPVLHLDMSVVADPNPDVLEQNLNNLIRNKCLSFSLPYDERMTAATNFENLLFNLPSLSKAPDKKYVVLIDEYDAPISGLLDSPKRRANLEDIRAALHAFYVKAKAHCDDMRFLMVTGVSKFARTSIFSAFNNPKDLSLYAGAADLLGYTHQEMETYFHEHIQAFADARGITYSQMFDLLLEWYDSYQFSPTRPVKVINPVSLGNALDNQEFGNYWEATAGSTLIYDALKAQNKAPLDFATEFSTSMLDAADALTAPTAALLYQGGYLTIDRRIDDETLLLKIPNNEVRQSLENGYIRQLLGTDFELDAMQHIARRTGRQLAEEGYTETFGAMLKSAYALLPRSWVCRDETEAKRYFQAFACFAHADVTGEPEHATGKPDAVLQTPKGIYIMEFKYGKSARAALQQCRDRNYAGKFTGDSRPIYYIGINYNPADNVRTVDDVICEVCDVHLPPGTPPQSTGIPGMTAASRQIHYQTQQ